MRKISKESKLYPILVIVTLIFLLSINVAYAYFTSRSYVVGDTNFATLDVGWIYRKESGSSAIDIANSSTINPVLSSINRGETVSFKIGGDSVNSLGFKTLEGSTGAYVRFWVDAYIVDSTNSDGTLNLGSVNYGKFFQLMISGVVPESNYSEENPPLNIVYYTSVSGMSWCIDSIKLLEEAPIDLLSKEVSLSISFEAVQSSNEAFKSVFNDWKGYSDSWS